jgi:hypothetical protein
MEEVFLKINAEFALENN